MKLFFMIFMIFITSWLTAGEVVKLEKGESYVAVEECYVVPSLAYKELGIHLIMFSRYEDFILKRNSVFVEPDKYIIGLESEVSILRKTISGQDEYIKYIEPYYEKTRRYVIATKALSIGLSISVSGLLVLVPFSVIGFRTLDSFIRNNY